jgi:hypothetical protein
MGSFKNESINIAFEQGIFCSIILHISKCCHEMKQDCHSEGEYLPNHEDKISNRLVERYLNTGSLGLRFIPQGPEHYDAKTYTYKGRTDIQVVSSEWFINRKAYYIIECKRIDGKTRLNQAYVSEGISRFVILPNPKYSSHYGRNIMLGYIVQSIKIAENTVKIDCIQRKMLAEVTIGKMELVCDDGKGFSHHKCTYQGLGTREIELAHLFYDFSDVMRENRQRI